jgi:hypothetical protein
VNAKYDGHAPSLLPLLLVDAVEVVATDADCFISSTDTTGDADDSGKSVDDACAGVDDVGGEGVVDSGNGRNMR